MACSASICSRYFGKKFSERNGRFLKPTNRSICQTTTLKQPKAVVLCRTTPISQNLTWHTNWTERSLKNKKMTVLMFDQSPKLRSMATSNHIDLTTMSLDVKLDFIQAQFWERSLAHKMFRTVVNLGLCTFESRKTAFLTLTIKNQLHSPQWNRNFWYIRT